ncbi:LysR family transcriptional regulator [Streptomyces albidoflavus]
MCQVKAVLRAGRVSAQPIDHPAHQEDACGNRLELEAFLVLAEELHFGRTPERLHVTTGRISQVLKTLEGRVGAPLIERDSRTVTSPRSAANCARTSRAVMSRSRGDWRARPTRRVVVGVRPRVRGFSAYQWRPVWGLVACHAALAGYSVHWRIGESGAKLDFGSARVLRQRM